MVLSLPSYTCDKGTNTGGSSTLVSGLTLSMPEWVLVREHMQMFAKSHGTHYMRSGCFLVLVLLEARPSDVTNMPHVEQQLTLK